MEHKTMIGALRELGRKCEALRRAIGEAIAGTERTCKLCKTCKWLVGGKCVHDGLAFAHDMWGDCEPDPDFGCVHHTKGTT